ncbi:hypothetical protein [Natrinema sp. H-ect4]|uniref:hypothetical protein n=1 Tax=Natrinema sp. H-ect4 TaxID=3242699 RepID=UPI0035A963D2
MPRGTVREQIRLGDNIRVQVHDIEDLRETSPNWDDLSERERLEVTRRVDPVQTHSTANTTTIDLHEYHVENLDPATSRNEDASHLAVGNDDSTVPSSGNSSLNNEVYRTGISDSSVKGDELFTSTFLDTTEANGETLVEVGLFTASSGGTLLNHSTIDPIGKTTDNTATIDVSLTWGNP